MPFLIVARRTVTTITRLPSITLTRHNEARQFRVRGYFSCLEALTGARDDTERVTIGSFHSDDQLSECLRLHPGCSGSHPAKVFHGLQWKDIVCPVKYNAQKAVDC